jgi:hypothetical protein
MSREQERSEEETPVHPQVDARAAFRSLQRWLPIDDQMRYLGPIPTTAQLMEGAELIFIEKEIITRDDKGNITDIQFVYERPNSSEVGNSDDEDQTFSPS